ncbi:hypothetical protein [Paenibacillus sp. NPDC058071]|uniref:hypothetical protein n=1 Tax=Paenibacillus sp. NPDC058071 TaxID=3346326 RepID=UPI0036DAFD89
MDRLISFLFDNIYLVIVVGGVLLSLFGRSGSKGGGRNRMPDFGSGGSLRPQGKTTENEDTELQPEPVRPVERPETFGRTERPERPVRATEARLATDYRAEARRPLLAEQQLGRAGGGSPFESSTAGREATSRAAAALPTDTEELRKAIVWAEVLGPPRAKKPYGRSK